MTRRQLNKEYADVMLKAGKAIGRKEAVSLLHRADSIRKKLHKVEHHPSEFCYQKVESNKSIGQE